MTRITICTAEHVLELADVVNQAIERLETDGFGVKSVLDMSESYPYALCIVYGHGPTTTQRWSGRTT